MKISDAICNLRWNYYQNIQSEYNNRPFEVWVDCLTNSELLMYLENYGDEGPNT